MCDLMRKKRELSRRTRKNGKEGRGEEKEFNFL
jgi:hypothetical protein